MVQATVKVRTRNSGVRGQLQPRRGPAEARDSGSVTFILKRVLSVFNAELVGGFGETEQLLVVGAHLDSVTAGPGINDNGLDRPWCWNCASSGEHGKGMDEYLDLHGGVPRSLVLLGLIFTSVS